MTYSIDLYWSYRSPYCYLGVDRLADMTRSYDLDVRVRPIIPIIVRDPGFLKKINPLLFRYIQADAKRVADWQGLPFRYPVPDPVNVDVATLTVGEDQPRIFRLTHLGIEAERRGQGLAFAQSVAHTLWSGKIDGWDEGDHLAKAAEKAGLDLAAMEAAIEADPAFFRDAIEANHAALTEAGHWGVPTVVVDGEPFFGQDRLDLVLWRLQQKGLKRRAS
jgi:2-hydroxychromene-2-carboxylate isomerase